jgi:SET family sugar efflux transporter-like MFS transporter
MRSGVSVVWIIGPALAFVVADAWGYKSNFYIALVLSVLVILMTAKYLPSFNQATESPLASGEQQTSISMTAFLLGLVIFLGNLANHVYLTAMPLYLTKELSIPLYFPGFLLGLTALFEIPVMLYAAKLSEKYGKGQLMVFGLLCAVIYFGLMPFVTSIELLLLLQVFNGLFYGVFVGLGITIIQDAFPEKGGFASAYYTNMMRIGMMFGTSLTGFIAQYFDFQTALFASLVCALIALPLMAYVSNKSVKNSIRVT